MASYKGHNKVVEVLIKAGADMNCVDNVSDNQCVYVFSYVASLFDHTLGICNLLML